MGVWDFLVFKPVRKVWLVSFFPAWSWSIVVGGGGADGN